MEPDEILVMTHSDPARRWVVSPAQPLSGPLDQLRVLTLNTWFEPKHRAERYEALPRALDESGADVIGLQEVTATLLGRIEQADWVKQECVLAVSPSVYTGYGVILISRLPARRAWELPLSSTMNRSVLALELGAGAETVVIASAHFESTRPLAAARIHQLRDAFSALEGYPRSVLTGDFNFHPGEREQDALDPRYLDVWTALRGDEPGYTEDTNVNVMRLEHHGKDKQVRYDRVLARMPGWVPTDVRLFGAEPISDGVFLSDHFGVCAALVKRAGSAE